MGGETAMVWDAGLRKKRKAFALFLMLCTLVASCNRASPPEEEAEGDSQTPAQSMPEPEQTGGGGTEVLSESKKSVVKSATTNQTILTQPTSSPTPIPSQSSRPPTIQSIPAQITTEDTPLQLSLNLDDLDGALSCTSQQLSYSSSDESVLGNSNAVVWGGSWPDCIATMYPVPDGHGWVSVTFVLTDGFESASQTFDLSVLAVNDAPTLSAVSDLSIDEDSVSGALSLAIGDADSTVLCSQVSATSSNTALIPAGNLSVAGGSATSCSITATPAAHEHGSTTITLSLTDNASVTTTRSFTLTVKPVNDAPTLSSISDQTINMNNSVDVSFNVGDVDSLSDISCSASNLSYSSSTISIVPSAAAVSWSGTIPNCVGTITPAANQFGDVNVTFQVQDGFAASAFRTFQLTVNDTRAAAAPTISGASSANSNVTDFVLSGACNYNYIVSLSGNVSASEVQSPSGSLDIICPSNGNYSYTIRKTFDGSYIFFVSQTNPLQQPQPPIASSMAAKIWIRDTEAPAALTLSAPVRNPTISRSGIFTLIGTCEPNATVNITSTTSGAYALSPAPSATTTCSASGTFSIAQSLGTAGVQNPGDGTYNYSLSQTDAGGNTSSVLTFTWTKDYQIPETPIISSPTPINSNNIYYTTSSAQTITITVSCNYTPSVHEVTINENGTTVNNPPLANTCLAGGTYTYTTTNHTDGSYPFEIFQTDVSLANPKSSAPVAFTWIRDTAIPAAPVFTNPSTSTVTSPANLYLSGTCETNATVIIYIDESPASETSCASGKFSTSVTRNNTITTIYSVTSKQRDPAGNLSVSSSTITWTQDPDSVPIPTITFPSGGSSISNSSLLVMNGVCQPHHYITIAAGSGTTLSASDVITPPGSFTQTCSAEGSFSYVLAKTGSTSSTTYNLNITQQGDLGGASSAPTPFEWTRDTVAPTTTISAASSNAYSGNALFTLSANETTINAYKCSTDNTTFTTCTSPYVYSFASETNPKLSHNIQRQIWVKALDTAGNLGSATLVQWTPSIYNTSLLYKFDGTTTNASSYSPWVQSNLQLLGGTNYTLATGGRFSNALSFSQTSDTATLGDNAILGTFLSTATVEFWLKTNSPTSGRLMGQQTSIASGLSWSINVAGAGANKYNITFLGSSSGTRATTILGSCALMKGNSTWQHIAVTFNKGNVVIYCNGLNAGSGVIGIAGSARLFDSASAFTIGGHIFSIDELRISQGIRYTGNFAVPTAAFAAD